MRRIVAVAPVALLVLALLACQSDYSVDTSNEGGSSTVITCDDSGVCQVQGQPTVDGGSVVLTDGSPATPDASGGPPFANGAPCAKPADCTSALCADSAILGQDVFNKTGAVCTKPCCTSEECGAGLVCVGPGTGGHYCVPAGALGRALGTGTGGHTCASGADCRAGVCIGKVCADSCCGDSTCGTAKCRPVDVSGNGHMTYACSLLAMPPICSMGSTVDACVSGVCASGACSPPCCGLATVSGTGNTLCSIQAIANGDTFNFSNGGAVGAGDLGTSCNLGTKCKTGYCDKADGATTGVCSDACCTDGDCPLPFVCRPRTGLSHFLRCTSP